MKTLFERMTEIARNGASIHDKLAASHPSLVRGRVWCRQCGSTRSVDSAECMRSGWPKCCGATMTIDAPDESGDHLSGEGVR